MNELINLIRAGAAASVRGFAVEVVRGIPAGVQAATQSPLVRAVRTIRREFNIPNTRAGYELARNVFRRAVSDARRADREQRRQDNLIERGIDPSTPPRRGQDSGRRATYTVFVELTSSRSSRTYRGQVNVVAPYGTPSSAIAQAARTAVLNREVESQSIPGRANYGSTPLQTWQVASYQINSISFDE